MHSSLPANVGQKLSRILVKDNKDSTDIDWHQHCVSESILTDANKLWTLPCLTSCMCAGHLQIRNFLISVKSFTKRWQRSKYKKANMTDIAFHKHIWLTLWENMENYK